MCVCVFVFIFCIFGIILVVSNFSFTFLEVIYIDVFKKQPKINVDGQNLVFYNFLTFFLVIELRQ